MLLIFQRDTSTKYGTSGRWIKDGKFYCFTLEPQEPSLPAGEYVLNRYTGGRHSFPVLRYERPDDPATAVNEEDPSVARHYWEVHPGSIYADTQGCTIPGLEFGDIYCADAYKPSDPRHNLGVIPGILHSWVALNRIMREIEDGTKITVRDAAT